MCSANCSDGVLETDVSARGSLETSLLMSRLETFFLNVSVSVPRGLGHGIEFIKFELPDNSREMNEYECHGDENKCVFRCVLKVGRLSRDRMAGGSRFHACMRSGNREHSVTEMSLGRRDTKVAPCL